MEKKVGMDVRKDFSDLEMYFERRKKQTTIYLCVFKGHKYENEERMRVGYRALSPGMLRFYKSDSWGSVLIRASYVWVCLLCTINVQRG